MSIISALKLLNCKGVIIVIYIFLHGLGQTSSSWNKTISYIEGQPENVCLDLSGLLHGKKITYANLYKAFSDYCTDFSEPLNICGLSLGGIIALQYGIENPSKVNSLVLIGTQFVMPKRLLKLQNIIFNIMPNSSFEQMGFGKKDLIQLSKSMIDLDFRNNLKNLICDVLVVCGEKDKVNKKASMDLNRLLPHSEIQLIENAGHEINIDEPEKLGRILNEFFCKNTL